MNKDDELTKRDIAALAESLAPLQPAPERKAALKSRILARVAAEASSPSAPAFVTMPIPETGWQALWTGVEMCVLHDHGAAQSFLLRMQPGAELPPHGHRDEELCVVLSGEVRLDDRVYGAGTFHLALPGSQHRVVRAETAALLFLRANLDHSI